MTSDRSTADAGRATRRGFLALAGTATLAGCNGVGDIGVFSGEDESPEIEGEALSDALSTVPPTVPERIPITVEQSQLDETTAAVRDRLEPVPTPFDTTEIPNGAIRNEISKMHEEATGALDDAASAPSPVEAMESLREARESARALAAAWEAIDAGLALADVRERIPRTRDAIETFRGRWRYVGDEPIRAVLVHGKIEELVAFAGRRIGSAGERYGRGLENPIRVGECAGALEGARAALADAEYLYDRYESSLADPRPIRSEMTAVGESLVRTLEDRLAALPDGNLREPSSFVERDIEGTPVATALGELYRELDYADGLEDEQATGQRAQVVLSVYETLVSARGFESLRERVANGDHATIKSASDVRQIRESAIEAFEDALASSGNSNLGQYVLSEEVGTFEYADRKLGEYDEDRDISADWLNEELGQYVAVGATARATPETSAGVADEIRRGF
ncbi:hypothetical protein [Halorussus pelagicus]|uniref:hypothetical protein n=1 Tax=Halorussus pelagicus TaxID=2505977 RepID=UPI000FFB0B75|nr:hypothetical protein [Halorussus pelagicus]